MDNPVPSLTSDEEEVDVEILSPENDLLGKQTFHEF